MTAVTLTQCELESPAGFDATLQASESSLSAVSTKVSTQACDWQPSGKIKVLYDSAVQKLLDEVGLSLLDAANKSEWHNITRLGPEALAAQARAAPSGVSAQVAAKRPSQAAVTKGAASSTSRAAASGASVTASATCKPESRGNLKPTKPAI